MSINPWHQRPVGIAYADPNLFSIALQGTLLTPTPAEYNASHDIVASVTTTAVNNTGSNAVQFVFKNAAGLPISSVRSMTMYTSDVNGVPATAVTSYATLTNGTIVTTKTGAVAQVNTTAAGLLGCTLTMTTGTYYLSFVLQNGTIITSTAIAT